MSDGDPPNRTSVAVCNIHPQPKCERSHQSQCNLLMSSAASEHQKILHPRVFLVDELASPGRELAPEGELSSGEVRGISNYREA